jgi:hypothetical protein
VGGEGDREGKGEERMGERERRSKDRDAADIMSYITFQISLIMGMFSI